MTRISEGPTREPVSHILREAARLSLTLRPTSLPLSARFLFAAIDEALEPLRRVEEPLRRRIALDTTITLCAEHAGERLMPATVHRVERVITRCFALHDLPRSCVARALKTLSIFCGGGIPVPSLMELANQVRDEQIRRAYRDGAGYPILAQRHGLTPRRIRQIVNPPHRRAGSGRREDKHRTLPGRARGPGRLLTRRRGGVPASLAEPTTVSPIQPGPRLNVAAYEPRARVRGRGVDERGTASSPGSARTCNGASPILRTASDESGFRAHARWGVRKCAD